MKQGAYIRRVGSEVWLIPELEVDTKTLAVIDGAIQRINERERALVPAEFEALLEVMAKTDFVRIQG